MTKDLAKEMPKVPHRGVGPYGPEAKMPHRGVGLYGAI
jgi:hypothetical protein